MKLLKSAWTSIEFVISIIEQGSGLGALQDDESYAAYFDRVIKESMPHLYCVNAHLLIIIAPELDITYYKH